MGICSTHELVGKGRIRCITTFIWYWKGSSRTTLWPLRMARNWEGSMDGGLRVTVGSNGQNSTYYDDGGINKGVNCGSDSAEPVQLVVGNDNPSAMVI